jgi:hypothetical protein
MATNGNKPFFMTSAGIYMQLSSLSNDSDLEGSDDLTLVFLNPSSHSFQLGWTIRNILAAIAFTR